MYSEEDLLPLSGLQHLLFCERRAALVHIEGIWDENVFTVEGSHLHRKVEDDLPVETRGDVRIARGLRVRSLRLGLVGKTDVVEFHRLSDESSGLQYHPDVMTAAGVALAGVTGLWKPFPVEYKRGRLRREEGYEVQLCAQAMCLEEMLAVDVLKGAIFYGKTRRRIDVVFDADLRRETEEAALRLHDLIASGVTPSARYDEKCESCSFISLCLPKATAGRGSVARYLAEVMREQGD